MTDSPSRTDKPNVLFITADQWRGDCLSVGGHPLVQTPHLDAIASEGVHFARHYAGAAPCSPARACLYTGLYQMNNRVCVNGTPLDRRHDNIAKAARRAGYDPTLFGYTDQSPDPRGLDADDPSLKTFEGVLPGFTWRLSTSDEKPSWRSWLIEQGYADALSRDVDIPLSGIDDPPTGEPPAFAAEHTETAYVADDFIRWQSEQDHTRPNGVSPWFAHVSFIRPHPPFMVPEPYNRIFSPDDVAAFCGKGKAATAAQHPYLDFLMANQVKGHFMQGAEGLVRDWNDQDHRVMAAVYYGMIAEVDAQIGRMVEAIKRSGQWDNTLLVFTSDHGEMMGDHGLLGKLGYFDQAYHIPLIIRDPRYKNVPRRRVDQFTEAVDVMPTLIDLLDSTTQSKLDGHSLQGAFTGTGLDNWRNAAHWEFDFRDIGNRRAEESLNLPSTQCNLSVLRGERYKYIHFAGLPSVLFDLQNDPHETHNLANDRAHDSIRLACAEELLSWRAEHLDQSLALSQVTEDGLVSA
jgi:arylsulfatase A-like enzyme